MAVSLDSPKRTGAPNLYPGFPLRLYVYPFRGLGKLTDVLEANLPVYVRRM